MPRLIALLLILLCPAAATAGIRATYAVEEAGTVVVEIADNGDVDAEMGAGRRLIVKAGEAFVVLDRLTGPIVMRLDDLAALGRERPAAAAAPAQGGTSGLIERGTAEIGGRTGRAFFAGWDPNHPQVVISADPALAELAPVLRRLLATSSLFEWISGENPDGSEDDLEPLLRPLEHGAPLQLGGWTLRTVERAAIAPDGIHLPAAPETRDAMRARLAAERAEAEREPTDDDMISRAAFAGGRLFLLGDNGALSSLAEGETRRTRHDPGPPVLDICAQDGDLLALTGWRGAGAWTLRRWHGGRWGTDRTVPRADDTAIALFCAPDATILLTSARLIDLSRPAAVVLNLSGEDVGARVNTSILATADAVFVGLNAGEWGGGLKRIDRRTGAVTRIARNAGGGGCDGPLNSDCDPVHGLAIIPWRPDCVAAAIGLIHFLAHGRITSVCGQEVEQLYAAADRIDATDANAVAEAASGGYGAVAFFGIAASGRELVAVGHNGLHRIGANGGAHQRWPRFVEVDGVYVSFALPDFVLVLTHINQRASISGAAPMLVVR